MSKMNKKARKGKRPNFGMLSVKVLYMVLIIIQV